MLLCQLLSRPSTNARCRSTYFYGAGYLFFVPAPWIITPQQLSSSLACLSTLSLFIFFDITLSRFHAFLEVRLLVFATAVLYTF